MTLGLRFPGEEVARFDSEEVTLGTANIDN